MAFAVVIPVKNEEHSILEVINTLLKIDADYIIPVINGCTDGSEGIIAAIDHKTIKTISFREPLGIDVPRAIGACYAYHKGVKGVLFVDGDMNGEIAEGLRQLKNSIIIKGVDLALTNCYTDESLLQISPLARLLLRSRKGLNSELGLYDTIGTASPTHGPHAISRRLMENVPFRELAIPSVELAVAAQKGLNIRLGTTIPHQQLGSLLRNTTHTRLVATTIIGDCLEAISVYHGKKRTRTKNGVNYTGYHPERRFDILDYFVCLSATLEAP